MLFFRMVYERLFTELTLTGYTLGIKIRVANYDQTSLCMAMYNVFVLIVVNLIMGSIVTVVVKQLALFIHSSFRKHDVNYRDNEQFQ